VTWLIFLSGGREARGAQDSAAPGGRKADIGAGGQRLRLKSGPRRDDPWGIPSRCGSFRPGGRGLGGSPRRRRPEALRGFVVPPRAEESLPFSCRSLQAVPDSFPGRCPALPCGSEGLLQAETPPGPP